MNYSIQKFIILSLLFLVSPKSLAYIPQRGNVNLILSRYTFKSQITNDTLSGDLSPNGFGLTAIGDVNPHGSLEISSIFYHKSFYRLHERMTALEESDVVHVTMGYRHYWSHWFSSSLSFFTAYPLGTVDVISRENATTDFQTSATKNSQSGMDLALQGELWASGRWGLQAEIRYSHYLAKLEGEDPHQLGVGLGIRYFLQSRVKKPREYKELNIENK